MRKLLAWFILSIWLIGAFAVVIQDPLILLHVFIIAAGIGFVTATFWALLVLTEE